MMDFAQRRWIWSARLTRIRQAWCGIWHGHPMAFNNLRLNDPEIINMRCPRCNKQWVQARTRGL